jgi:hypothetical protein
VNWRACIVAGVVGATSYALAQRIAEELLTRRALGYILQRWPRPTSPPGPDPRDITALQEEARRITAAATTEGNQA